MISTIILTKNEETDLPHCLRSLAWCDDIHIVDSGSVDSTVSVAQSFFANVYVHPFESFGQQRNWALQNCNLKHRWVLFLDADEETPSGFVTDLTQSISNASPEVAGFYCCWKMMFLGTWLRRTDSFPKWQFRVVQVGRGSFTDFGHGQKEGEISGTLSYLRTPYLHFPLRKGIAHWIDRHNRYSSLEAAARLNAKVRLRDILSRHGSKRNQALKPLVSRLPGWPIFRFLQMYLLKLGVLEGRAGLIYSVNMAYYEFLIRAKISELRLQSSELSAEPKQDR